MVLIPLWQLATELGCSSAYELITGRQYRHIKLGKSFYLDGIPVHIDCDVDDPSSIQFTTFRRLGYHTLRLTTVIANQLSIDLRAYTQIKGKPFTPEHEAVHKRHEQLREESIKEQPKSGVTKDLIVVSLLSITAITLYKSGVVNLLFPKESNTKK